MDKAFSESKVLKTLQRYCVYQDRCHRDVLEKMKSIRVPYSLHDTIIVGLIQDDFLNEERFVESFTRGKFRVKNWGKIKLRIELRKRNITSKLIEKYISKISNKDYSEKLNEISLKKFDSLEGNIISKKHKFHNYLTYRGWENELIFKKMNELFKG